ncbi:MAG: M1 family metallopeptidase [Lewinellaceae bacterium]|nr:M1 family metallopeptidase [Lewinellaceae bacterium]MCB9290220.1 M1 family metallopeptidase [Lewinellaceae bacterium]
MLPKLFILLCLLFSAISPALSQGGPLSPRIANYDIQVRLDTAEKKIYGRQVLLWNNPSADTVRELQYHLYLNAFRNTQSTFMQEAGGFGFMIDAMKEGCGWGWVEIESLKDGYGNNLARQMEYIAPDDGNADDRTVLRAPLPRPVLPGGSIEVEMEWVSKVPRAAARTGYNRDYYFMAQWFPKVGVYEPAGVRFSEKGQWNCHQFHAEGEFYSDFGVYNVEVTVPKGFIVGGSGVLREVKEEGEVNTWHFRAEDVIDFTWAASPYFKEVKENYKGIDIRLLAYPYHEHLAERYFRAVRYAIDFCESRFGRYPYPGLTIIDPPFHGMFSSAMEYPTLISTANLCFLPKGVKTSELLLVHEFVHQYFMQMVASNEQEEPWLDEGITNYYEARIMDELFGPHTSTVDWLGFGFGNMESNRGDYFGMDDPKIADYNHFSWQFPEGSTHPISYNKTTLWLHTLEGLVGTETLDEVMHAYFQRWKFRHPCGRDFIAVANEVITQKYGNRFGENLDWFFNQVLYSTRLCDYALASISNTPVQPPAGIFEDGGDCVQPDAAVLTSFRSEVRVHRLEGLYFPVEVRVIFEDGKTVAEHWDGKARSKAFVYEGPAKVVAAEVDPERKIYLDKNFMNNSLTLQPPKKGLRRYAVRFLLWMQQVMQSVSVLV